MRVNNVALATNGSISFGNSSTILIYCGGSALRPIVDLNIYDVDSNVALPIRINRAVACINGRTSCSVAMTASLTPGYAYRTNLKTIRCLASNQSFPFNASASLTHTLDFNSKLERLNGKKIEVF